MGEGRKELKKRRRKGGRIGSVVEVKGRVVKMKEKGEGVMNERRKEKKNVERVR